MCIETSMRHMRIQSLYHTLTTSDNDSVMWFCWLYELLLITFPAARIGDEFITIGTGIPDCFTENYNSTVKLLQILRYHYIHFGVDNETLELQNKIRELDDEIQAIYKLTMKQLTLEGEISNE